LQISPPTAGRWITASAVAAAIAAAGLWPTVVGAGPRDALWYVIRDICLPIQKTLGTPLPCLEADAKRGFVVIRAPAETTHFVVAPTERIEGIESPLLLSPQTPNFWSLAWNEKSRVISSASRPLGWDDIGMAINSRPNRTQDQLHIHIDCVDARLKRALAERRISSGWSALDLRPWAGRYQIRRIAEPDIDRNIFQLVADEIPGARANMGLQTIALVRIGDGFVLLVNSKGGHAEDLLDHQCLAAR
jgi:CDP-diacylglycerol pyrophosphatase